uniref:Uncharacterized protein n=1 Tax=Trichuris muris TaxID=70415 RepID=A0A5S6R121_TRIMR
MRELVTSNPIFNICPMLSYFMKKPQSSVINPDQIKEDQITKEKKKEKKSNGEPNNEEQERSTLGDQNN